MPATPSRADPNTVASVSPNPAVNTTPTPHREENRLFRLRLREWGNQFAVRLRTNIQWMKQFLHGGK